MKKKIMREISAELKRARRTHPEDYKDIIHQVAVMAEESGEAVRATLNYRYERASLSAIKEELLQTAAMCVRMLENIEDLPEYFENA
jgi:NTP pyrophosphatase (non-canonical NTP hydrolase)